MPHMHMGSSLTPCRPAACGLGRPPLSCYRVHLHASASRQRHRNKTLRSAAAARCYKPLRPAKPSRAQVSTSAYDVNSVGLIPEQLQSSGFGTLFQASTVPVAKVAFICALGAFLSRSGLLTKEGRFMVSKLVISVFTPCLLLSKLGGVLTLPELSSTWPLAANQAIGYALGILLGQTTALVTQAPARIRPHVTLATSIGNVGNLPLVLVTTLLADPRLSEVFQGADVDTGVLYVMIGWFWGSFLQFPLAYLMLAPKEEQAPEETSALLPGEESLAWPPGQGSAIAVHTGRDGPLSPIVAASLEPESRSASPSIAVLASDPQFARSSAQLLPDEAAAQPGGQHPPTFLARLSSMDLSTLAAGVFTPPTIACLGALVLASLPPLQASLFAPEGGLRFVGDSLDMLGSALIPCMLLCLGATLENGPGAGNIPLSCLLGVLVSRLVLMPGVMTGALLVSERVGVLPPPEPLMLLVMLMVNSTPTAILVHTVASVQRNGEVEMSAILFWEYLAALLTLPVCLAVFLYIVQLHAAATPAV